MAKKQKRPGRRLIAFFTGVAIAFGLVALTGTWSPGLGLDLQGGTRITLQAKGSPSQANLDEARGIIDDRVNGSGITEAEVNTEGGDTIAVEIPGEEKRDLVETVQRQAQLRFRLVACQDVCNNAPATAPDTGTGVPPATDPGPGATPGDKPDRKGDKTGSQGTSPRPPVSYGADDGKARTDRNGKPATKPTDKPTDTPTDPSATPTDPSATPTEGANPEDDIDQSYVSDLDKEYAWTKAPDQASVAKFNSLQCSADGTLQTQDGEPASVIDDPTEPLVACSPPEGKPEDGDKYRPSAKYLLSEAIIEGTDLKGASYGIPQNEVGYVVSLEIGGQGKDVFSAASTKLTTDVDQFAIVLDGAVISAPTFQGRIPDGNAQISGNFNETSAKSLATSLKYGALPIAFDSSADVVGPSLAGDQLKAGITAGIFGLALVMVYCLFYYRGLGLVVLASLVMAAAITYAMVLLLSATAGFTLTLPGIAGLIIAVGITADSFIILFERIRDEMRDGKSMRVAVETGWAKARDTTLAADGVSLLAAIVLYISAAGVVKGFAFALGLSTLIDLLVFFYFTKPMMSYLGRFRFFSRGHKYSGLSAETLGVDTLVGGKA